MPKDAVPAPALALEGQSLPEDIKLRHETKPVNGLDWSHERKGLSDHFAYAACRGMRFFADTFFRKRYGHRAVVLETVAAVPGMVSAGFNHFRSLRTMEHDAGRIRILLDEAENERMHLMVFREIAKPTLLERAMIVTAQAAFVGVYSLAYLFNKRAAHRFVGMIEEEAIKSYTSYLEEVDAGRIKNVDAPEIAKKYWNLAPDAKLRDVIIAVRNDEAEHRDVNHGFANQLDAKKAEHRASKRQKKPKAEKKKEPQPSPAKKG
jgi:ubiquinol oxidase